MPHKVELAGKDMADVTLFGLWILSVHDCSLIALSGLAAAAAFTLFCYMEWQMNS